MNETTNLPPQTEYKDRRSGLIAFGILLIALGCLCALVLAMMFIALSLAPQPTEALNRQTLGFGVAFYGLISAALIWLGVGSILCRRWARALVLIGSWCFLISGVISLGFFAVFARRIFAQAADLAGPLSMATIWIFIAVFLGIFFIILPAAMVLFYQSPHVKATCEARDPLTRWTDRCPLPVLTCSLWFAFGAVCLLLMPAIHHSVVPWFGSLLSGTPAALVLLACAAICLYLAWVTYRLRMAGWWVTLAAFTLFSASVTLTFLRVDIMELYRRFGYPEEQIKQISSLGFLTGRTTAWWTVAFYALFLIYMTWIRKYFRKE